jgi:hypothetical protein
MKKRALSAVDPTQAKTGLDPDFLYATPATATCAAFIEESRMKFTNANKFHRKFGKWGTQPSLPVRGKRCCLFPQPV